MSDRIIFERTQLTGEKPERRQLHVREHVWAGDFRSYLVFDVQVWDETRGLLDYNLDEYSASLLADAIIQARYQFHYDRSLQSILGGIAEQLERVDSILCRTIGGVVAALKWQRELKRRSERAA